MNRPWVKAVAWISFSLCLLVLGLYIASYFVELELHYRSSDSRWAARAATGRTHIERLTRVDDAPTGFRFLTVPVAQNETAHHNDYRGGPYGFDARRGSALGIERVRGTLRLDDEGTRTGTFSAIVIPFWLVVPLLAVLPALRSMPWVRERSKRKRRIALGLCPDCAFDLRKAPDAATCPRCNAAAVSPRHPQGKPSTITPRAA